MPIMPCGHMPVFTDIPVNPGWFIIGACMVVGTAGLGITTGVPKPFITGIMWAVGDRPLPPAVGEKVLPNGDSVLLVLK